MSPNKTGNRYVNTLAIIASLGGFLFGYDTAVISGTISFVTSQFQLDAAGTGWYVSSALVGCILGVSVAGILSDKCPLLHTMDPQMKYWKNIMAGN